ncbi:MAG TPA: signal peptidase II, partial [Opitutaceae bacterium]|nr:signal peptidase II [Opitutaceae bacterium]
MSTTTSTSGERRPPLEPHPLIQPTLGHRVRAYRWFFGLAVLVLVLDQLSKAWILSRLPLGAYGRFEGITIIPDFFYIVHVGNTGAAWSLFTGRSTVLALLAAATLASIFIWRRDLGLKVRAVQISFGLL